MKATLPVAAKLGADSVKFTKELAFGNALHIDAVFNPELSLNVGVQTQLLFADWDLEIQNQGRVVTHIGLSRS